MSAESIRVLLAYILDHAENDERAYLKVDILGRELLALLDCGATRTFIGGPGWKLLSRLGLKLNQGQKHTAVLANSSKMSTSGTVDIPIRVRNRITLLQVIVALDLPSVLVLGVDFFIKMGIVPDLRRGEWFFSGESEKIFSLEMEKQQVQTVLTSREQAELQAVVDQFKQSTGAGLGCTTRTEHVINAHSAPIKQRYYRVSPVMQKFIDSELDEMLKLGVVEKSNSPWASPIVLVRKKGSDKFRFCVDYRKLNSVTVRDSYPLPLVSDILDKLNNAHYLTSLDVKSAYWQVSVSEASRPLTAFVVPNRGLFQFKRMPFGLHNAPATWQRLMDEVLGPELEPHVFVYLDDIVIVTQTFEQHLIVLEEVLRRLSDANITISWDKCQFCRKEMRYLGYVVDARGLQVDREKVAAMLELPRPQTVKEVRRVVGTFSWYRRFVPEFASIVAPLSALTKKNRKFVWTSECEESFRKIKERLVEAPILSCPDYSLPFSVQTDASAYGIGAVLTQPHPTGDRVICYLSRSLSKLERNYSTTERECLAVIWAIEKLRPYIEGIHFEVVTDHYSLKWLQHLKDPLGRLARWSVRLQQFDFSVTHRRGKDMVVPDMLSRSVPLINLVDVQKANPRDPVATVPDNSASHSDKWWKKMVEAVANTPLKFPTWRLTNGQLYKYVKQDYPALTPHGECWKLVVPKKERIATLRSAHDSPLAGHMGVYKTYARLAEKYYWPKMRSDVASFVRRCSLCMAHKPDHRTPKDMMVSHAKPSRPWEMVSTDLMGPLPRSLKGMTYILVVTDYFSKFSMVFPLRNSNATTVIKNIEENVFLVFGVPRVVLCDNGPQFRGKEFRKFIDNYKCKVKWNANYHPRANPTERQNATIKTMLAIYVHENHRTWDQELPKLACALRTAKQETTKLTPYFINFGRNMCLSGADYDSLDPPSSELETTPDPITRNESFKTMFADVKRRLELAGKKTVERYNLRRRLEEYLPNQLVWRKNYVLSDAAKYFTKKLAPKYLGPFQIHKRISPWTYVLRTPDGDVLPGAWHIKDLKGHPPDQNQ